MTSSKNWPANYADETPIYSELAIGDVPHLAEHFWLGAKEATPADDINAAIGSLPYAQLGDMGFERLCFHLVLAEGHAPRFWGRRGQAQQGIDLIISDGGSSTVIQCKNHTRYDVKKLKSALDKFRKEWIEAQPAPAKPKTFILCTSAELKDRAEWEKCKSQFWKEFDVGVELRGGDVILVVPDLRVVDVRLEAILAENGSGNIAVGLVGPRPLLLIKAHQHRRVHRRHIHVTLAGGRR